MKKPYKYIKNSSVRALRAMPLRIMWAMILKRKILLISTFVILFFLPIAYLTTRYQSKTEAAGQGILLLGAPEVIIYNDKITKDSLVYLTKTGDTGNEPLTVVKKVVGERPYFSVSSGNSMRGEIRFNWLIIN